MCSLQFQSTVWSHGDSQPTTEFDIHLVEKFLVLLIRCAINVVIEYTSTCHVHMLLIVCYFTLNPIWENCTIRVWTHTHTLQSKLAARDDIEKCSHINPIFFFPPSFMVAVISAIILFITSSHFRRKFFIAHNCRDTRWKIVRRIFTHWIFITCVILVTRYICSDDSRDCPNLCQLALENCLWSWPSI